MVASASPRLLYTHTSWSRAWPVDVTGYRDAAPTLVLLVNRVFANRSPSVRRPSGNESLKFCNCSGAPRLRRCNGPWRLSGDGFRFAWQHKPSCTTSCVVSYTVPLWQRSCPCLGAWPRRFSTVVDASAVFDPTIFIQNRKKGALNGLPHARGRHGHRRRFNMVGRRNYHAWPTCNAFARSTGKPCRRKVAVGEDGRPRPRCLGHGGHVKSGVQTVEGRNRINAATSKRMRAFWQAWREQGKPPLPWRESLRTAKPKRRVAGPRPKPPVRKIVLTAEEIAFGRKIGLLKAA
jgi:hypothetical protein